MFDTRFMPLPRWTSPFGNCLMFYSELLHVSSDQLGKHYLDLRVCQMAAASSSICLLIIVHSSVAGHKVS